VGSDRIGLLALKQSCASTADVAAIDRGSTTIAIG